MKLRFLTLAAAAALPACAPTVTVTRTSPDGTTETTVTKGGIDSTALALTTQAATTGYALHVEHKSRK